jgi:hypothetical protein
MDDLLKEAIADAKAVRETALENAKMALEEAFTPRLQNMLSQKIQTEMEDEDEKDVDEISYKEDDEDPSDDDVDEISYKEDDEDPSDDADEDPSDVDETKIIEIDGVKYAPVVSEEEDEDEMDEIAKDDDEDMEEDLDLESVIKELESELEEGEDKDEKEEMDENDVSSDIGNGDNKVNKKANDSSGVGSDGKAKLKEGEDKDEDEMDEDIDLDEVLKALSEEEDEDEKKDEVSELKSDLEEHRSVIETLRGKLNEVNLLNAKLLFTNKLFRKHGLNNEQKMKVVEQFDRASNLREVKLVYSTLGESFGARKNEINEHKGSASKPIASTKSEKKVITESSDLRDRFKKLANLI